MSWKLDAAVSGGHQARPAEIDTRASAKIMKFSSLGIVVVTLLIAGFAGRLAAFPVNGDQTVLPAGTELNEDALTNPREVWGLT
jgi:hypothetical protein